MSTTVASEQEPHVDQPKHPLHAMTTFELRDYRRQLESAIAFLEAKNPGLGKRDALQAKLDDVLAEEESRRRLADA